MDNDRETKFDQPCTTAQYPINRILNGPFLLEGPLCTGYFDWAVAANNSLLRQPTNDE